jgi:hypothetical protein
VLLLRHYNNAGFKDWSDMTANNKNVDRLEKWQCTIQTKHFQKRRWWLMKSNATLSTFANWRHAPTPYPKRAAVYASLPPFGHSGT